MNNLTRKIAIFILILFFSRISAAGDSGDHLLDDPILPGFGDAYTEQANRIVEDVIIQAVASIVDNEKRQQFSPRSWKTPTSPTRCLNSKVVNNHTLATFATLGGLRNLYRWARNHKGWQHTYNYSNVSALAVAIDHNLLYMAKDIWAADHPFSYNKVHAKYAIPTLSYMMEKEWPLRGFEAAWEAGERFPGKIRHLSNNKGFHYTGRTKNSRADIVEYLREKETHPTNHTRLQVLLNKFEEADEATDIVVLTEAHFVAQNNGCPLFSGMTEGISRAIDNETLSKQVALSFNIHGQPLLHYLVSLDLIPAAKKVLQQEYALELAQYRDAIGRDGLITAIDMHSTEITRVLLDRDPTLATVIIPSRDGYQRSGDSPLHFAIRNGAPEGLIKILLERSNRTLLAYKDAEGFTPAFLLEYLYDNEMISGERYLQVRKALRQ